MNPPLDILARGSGPAAARMTLHPASDRVLKDEPATRIWIETLPNGDEAAIKLYFRRRAVSALARSRAEREFRALGVLEAAGLPTTPRLFWARGQAPGIGRYDLLATRWLPDAEPLLERLRAAARPDLLPLFREVARMHAAGLHHGALIPRNILLRGDPPAFLIMDTPRAAIFPRDIRGTRMAAFDLLDLMQELLLHGAPDLRRDWLDAYGLPSRARDRLLAQSLGYRSTRRLRNWHGIETKFRLALAPR